jgi:hypothetical protein
MTENRSEDLTIAGQAEQAGVLREGQGMQALTQ